MKIAISGSQGLGKTTLANSISNLYNIDFLKVDTSSLMPRGVKSHKDVLKMSILKPEKGIKFQTSLIENRYKLFQENKNFISDRAVLDSYIYYLLHNSMFDTSENSSYLEKIVNKSLKELDFLILFNPSIDVERCLLTDNNIRFTNYKYFKLVNENILQYITNLLCIYGEINNNFIVSKNIKKVKDKYNRIEIIFLSYLKLYVIYVYEDILMEPKKRAKFIYDSIINIEKEKINNHYFTTIH